MIVSNSYLGFRSDRAFGKTSQNKQIKLLTPVFNGHNMLDNWVYIINYKRKDAAMNSVKCSHATTTQYN